MTVELIKTNKKATAVGTKSAKPVVVKSEVYLRAEKIVQIYPALKAAQTIVKGYDDDRKFLASHADSIGADNEEVVFHVDGGTIKFSAKGSQTKINDAKAIHKMLGDEAFYKLLKFSADDLKKYLSAKEIESVSTTDMTGPRRISVTVTTTSTPALPGGAGSAYLPPPTTPPLKNNDSCHGF